MPTNYYFCKQCGKVLKRESDKWWIRSWCEKADRYTRPRRIAKEDYAKYHKEIEEAK